MSASQPSASVEPATGPLPSRAAELGGSDRRLLLIAPTEYDASVAKGVSALLHDFDEKGYFSRVIMVFPFTRHNRRLALASNLDLHELGITWPAALARRAWFRKLTAPLHILRIVPHIARIARREGITVVRATDPCLSGLVALLVARLTGKPLCVSLHADFDKRNELDPAGGAPRVMGSRRLAIAIERQVLTRADLVLPIRDSLVAYAARRGAPAERIRVIPHGADLSAFTSITNRSALAPLDLPAGRRIVSFVGRLSKENYIDDVLAVARHLAESGSDALVVIAGGGGEEKRVAAALAADQKLADTVRLIGFQPRPVVAALRQASAVALCPMGGFSLIEACASGVPVVAYDAEWHRELVHDGETGLLVAERDSAGLAQAVIRLLNDERTAQRMGAAARQLAISRHDIDVAVAKKRQCYEALIALSAGR